MFSISQIYIFLISLSYFRGKTEADMQTGTQHNAINHEKTVGTYWAYPKPRKYWTGNTLFWLANISYKPFRLSWLRSKWEWQAKFGRNKCITFSRWKIYTSYIAKEFHLANRGQLAVKTTTLHCWENEEGRQLTLQRKNQGFQFIFKFHVISINHFSEDGGRFSCVHFYCKLFPGIALFIL